MVRLKVENENPSFDHETVFQFQYGSIKSLEMMHEQNELNLFQFQYGSIKSNVKPWIKTSLHLFQFQYGSIKSF